MGEPVSALGAASTCRTHAYLPGRMVELPGRGSTYVTDTPGRTRSAPAIVLLHALGAPGC